MNPSPACVWLVDDDDDDLLLLEAAFDSVRPDVRIQLLHDGEELLPQLEHSASPPSLIVLDLNMVRVDGLEALRRLRASTEYGQLPVVMLTTSSNPADEQQSARLGANDYFRKPNTFPELTQLAQRLLDQWAHPLA
jgi:two-component system response regulator